MELRLTTPALRDIAAILEYIHSESPAGAQHVCQRFAQTFRYLQTFPKSGRLTERDDNTRRVVVPGIPFIVIYRIESEVLEILRIRHTSRNPKIENLL